MLVTGRYGCIRSCMTGWLVPTLLPLPPPYAYTYTYSKWKEECDVSLSLSLSLSFSLSLSPSLSLSFSLSLSLSIFATRTFVIGRSQINILGEMKTHSIMLLARQAGRGTTAASSGGFHRRHWTPSLPALMMMFTRLERERESSEIRDHPIDCLRGR
jgi:hypothetical protein